MKITKIKLMLLAILLSGFQMLSAQNSKDPKMIFVEGGTFEMGSQDGENDEKPVHKVVISNFYISKTEITVAQYYEFCNESGWPKPEVPMWGDFSELPIVNVSWKDAGAYALWLARKTSKKYRLPTEAEWEYAAKGGNKSKNYKFGGSNSLDSVAWFYETTYGSSAQPVSLRKTNELGISDMSGNVWEWCKDSYSWKYSDKPEEANIDVTLGGNYRVIRGGGWDSESNRCRVTNRDRDVPESKKDNLGFRVVYGE